MVGRFLQVDERSFAQYLAVKRSADKTGGFLGAESKTVMDSIQAREYSSFSMVGTVGQVPVVGLLVPKRDWRLEWYGIEHTSYDDIYNALVELERDDRVDTVELYLNSPGGFIDGLDEVVELVKNYSKPVVGRVGTMSLSACYKIASVCGEIQASTPGSMFGSIGTLVELTDWSGWENEVGIKTHVITNRSSEEKRPDISKQEGRDVYRDELDQIQEVFDDYIEYGRSSNSNFSMEKVRALAGRVVATKEALKLGMVDVLLSSKEKKPQSSNNDSVIENKETYSKGDSMDDLKKMCAKDENLQKQLDQIVSEQTEAAVKNALAADRKRVGEIAAVCGMEESGDFLTAVNEGTDAGQFAIAFVKASREDGAGKSGAGTGKQNNGEQREKSVTPSFVPEDPNAGKQAGKTPEEKQMNTFIDAL